jgi:flagellin-specific chaperone FliS
MFTASQKRKENIAEYLLYMWQIEDLIRANGCDLDRITTNIVDRYNLDADKRRMLIEWYESLIDMMRSEGVLEKGHLQINKNIISELARLNNAVLAEPRFDAYAKEFYKTLPFIVELRAKAGENKVGEIETCFNALYGMLLLRIQQKEVSKQTEDAVKQIGKFVSMLAKYFYLDERDELFKDSEE